jgi:hypothetical protein
MDTMGSEPMQDTVAWHPGSTAGVHIFPSTQIGLVVNFAVPRKSLISTRGTLRV